MRRDWFDENHAEIMDLIGEKHAVNLVHLHDPQCTISRKTLSGASARQFSCLKCKIPGWELEIQGYADKNDMKIFYSSSKKVYGPISAGSFLLLSADGTKPISEKNKILER